MDAIFKDKKKCIILIISIFILGIALWFFFHNNNDTMIMIDDQDKSNREDNIEDLKSKEDEVGEVVSTEEKREIMVHITGQVKNPGVARLIEGERLIDGINKLGGTLEEADLDRINLAKKVMDEEKIYIPKKGEKIPQENQTQTTNSSQEEILDDKININTADQQLLKTLPGIGDVLSNNIIEYRMDNSGFRSIEEIKEVNRIGEKIFDQIKDKIKI